MNKINQAQLKRVQMIQKLIYTVELIECKIKEKDSENKNVKKMNNLKKNKKKKSVQNNKKQKKLKKVDNKQSI